MDQELLEVKKAQELVSAQLKKEIQIAQASRKKIPLEIQKKKVEDEYLESDEDSIKTEEMSPGGVDQDSLLNNSILEGSLKAIVNKVNTLPVSGEPLQIQSMKAKLNTPVLGDKKDKIN